MVELVSTRIPWTGEGIMLTIGRGKRNPVCSARITGLHFLDTPGVAAADDGSSDDESMDSRSRRA